MRNIALVDTGAIVALFSRRDSRHKDVFAAFGNAAKERVGLITTWPVLTETCWFLDGARSLHALEWVARAGIKIQSIDSALDFIRREMIRYADLPCSFADASLIYAAHATGARDILSIDSDFQVYRLPDRSPFAVIPGAVS